MAVYELTVRFEAEDDGEAFTIARAQEQILAREWDPPISWPRTPVVVERLTRVLVTHMPAGGQPC